MSTHEHGHHDDWFAHTREEGLPQEEHASHVDTRALLIFYMLMLAFVVVSVIAVILFFQRYVLGVRQDRIETLNLAEARAHPDFQYREETGEEKFHSFAGVPIVYRERAVGVLCVQHVEPRRYEEIEIEA